MLNRRTIIEDLLACYRVFRRANGRMGAAWLAVAAVWPVGGWRG